MRKALPFLFFIACAHAKKPAKTDRILDPGDYLVRVPDAEAYELATVVGPAPGGGLEFQLVPSGRKLAARKIDVRAPAEGELQPGWVIYYTAEGKDGDVEALRRADWTRGVVRAMKGATVMLGEGRYADARWHVLVPLVPELRQDAEPQEPK